VLENDKFAKWANENILVVVGHREADHDFEEVQNEAGETVKRCGLYRGLTCAEHEAATRDCHSGEAELPKIEEKSGVPNCWLVAPTGEIWEIEGGDRFQYKAIIERVEEHQKDIGKHLSRKKYLKYEESLATGDAALEEGKFKDALKAYAKVEKDLKKLPEGMADTVAERIEKLDAAVRDAMEKIRDGGEAASAQLKAARELEKQVTLRLKSGHLPVKADLDAWIKELKQAVK
jgi:hypothetical protein